MVRAQKISIPVLSLVAALAGYVRGTDATLVRRERLPQDLTRGLPTACQQSSNRGETTRVKGAQELM